MLITKPQLENAFLTDSDKIVLSQEACFHKAMIYLDLVWFGGGGGSRIRIIINPDSLKTAKSKDVQIQQRLGGIHFMPRILPPY